MKVSLGRPILAVGAAIGLVCAGFTAMPALAQDANAQSSSSNSYEDGLLVDPTSKTLCLAMGHSFKSRAAQIGDKMTAFDQAFPDPDADQKSLRDQLVGLQGQLDQLGESLESLYGDADAPDQTEQSAVDSLSVQDLLSASKSCVQQ